MYRNGSRWEKVVKLGLSLKDRAKLIAKYPPSNLVGARLAAIGNATSLMLKVKGGGNRVLIELLSDSGRLLAGLHGELACLNLNKNIKETLISSPIGEWLFGGDLGEPVKTGKILEKLGQELKASLARSKKIRKPLTAKSLNSKSLFRTRFLKVYANHGSLELHDHSTQQRQNADRISLVPPKEETCHKKWRDLTNTVIRPGGRLRYFSHAWRNFTSNRVLLGWLNLLLERLGRGVLLKRIDWSSKKLEILQASVSKLLEMVAITEIFIHNSLNLTISLLDTKRMSLIRLIKRFLVSNEDFIRDFVRLIDTLISVCPVVRYGWLSTKLFKRHKAIALKKSLSADFN
ncbi:hypothetical protein ILUMI_25332 [Ignelater luminosus]|uniref:Uncharacterized protein n=1 Tax=Ignelater luminosus TaxID=2038154 RepID=A0A8K0G016_IGNLU|nr:hypothetical protein ILUMI_25332 [Ignelater luminosus]